jgi:hypothetical protein
VNVIIDRHRSERRDKGATESSEQRTVRDRRRPRVPGEFPAIDAE